MEKKVLVKKEYEVVKENGKETKRTLKSEKTVRESQDQIVAGWNKSSHCSSNPVEQALPQKQNKQNKRKQPKSKTK